MTTEIFSADIHPATPVDAASDVSKHRRTLLSKHDSGFEVWRCLDCRSLPIQVWRKGYIYHFLESEDDVALYLRSRPKA